MRALSCVCNAPQGVVVVGGGLSDDGHIEGFGVPA